MNPFHKPAGHHKPVVDPPPVRTLSVFQRWMLMLSDRPPSERVEKPKPLPEFMRKHQEAQDAGVFDLSRRNQ